MSIDVLLKNDDLTAGGLPDDTVASVPWSLPDDTVAAPPVVNLRQVRRIVTEVYATRDNLARSLKDANSIAESLASMVVVGLRVLGIFAGMWVLNVDVNALFVPAPAEHVCQKVLGSVL